LKRLLGAAFILAALIGVAQAECYLPWDARPDLRMQWLQTDCRYHFPPRDGFAGPSKTVLLRPGTVVDRFGRPGGRFLAPADASYMGRAVPYDRLKMPYFRYEGGAPAARRRREGGALVRPAGRRDAIQDRTADKDPGGHRLPETGLVTLLHGRAAALYRNHCNHHVMSGDNG